MNLFQVARINEGRFSCLNSRYSHRSVLQVSQLVSILSNDLQVTFSVEKGFHTKREREGFYTKRV